MASAAAIAVLGGSSAFTPALAAELAAASDHLPPLDVRLCGRAADRTRAVARYCQAVAGEAGAPHRYSATTSIAEAAGGVAVVVNQMRVGGFAGRTHDDTFALAHGVPGDETIGPGGLASAMRSVPVVTAAAREVAAVADRPWFVNLTNPLGILVRALGDEPGVRAFGLCELPGHVLAQALALVGRTRADVDVDYFGLNHQGWFTRIEADGRDLMPEILAAVARAPEMALVQRAVPVARANTVLPLPYLRLYADPRAEAAAARARPQPRGEELAAISRSLHAQYAAWRPGLPAPLPAELRRRPLPWLREAVVPCLRALLAGERHELYVTMRNGSVYPLVQEDAPVELRCEVDGDGPRPCRLLRRPPVRALKYALHIASFERWALRAARSRERRHVLRALRAHPFFIDAPTAVALADPVLQELP
jgi:6-phospho-beta-glucosidase